MASDEEAWVRFLLAEHQLFKESSWKNEEVGDRRVDLLLAFVTATITALVLLATATGSILSLSQVLLISLPLLSALLLLGHNTLRRMVKRNLVTDQLSRDWI